MAVSPLEWALSREYEWGKDDCITFIEHFTGKTLRPDWCVPSHGRSVAYAHRYHGTLKKAFIDTLLANGFYSCEKHKAVVFVSKDDDFIHLTNLDGQRLKVHGSVAGAMIGVVTDGVNLIFGQEVYTINDEGVTLWAALD